jgi:serine protease
MSEDDIQTRTRRNVLKLTGLAFGGAGLGRTVAATPGRDPGPKKDELLVGVAKTAPDLKRAVEKHVPGKADVVHANDRIGYVAVKFPEATSDRARRNFKRAITNKEHVRYVEDNGTMRALYTPNDPRYGDQYAPQQVNADDAWDTTLGDSSVTISVVDQGIQYDHENLQANVDGSVSNYGKDFADDDDDPYPVAASENHGTHVGGIAGGGTDDGVGHAGISDCSLLSARALDDSGGGSFGDIADAITWSADRGADVINMSLGASSGSSTVQNAVSYAQNQGSLLVAAAGNDYGGSVSYPAAYDEVLAVSALDENENLASYSNTGPEIELAAPGSSVLSTVPFGDYDTLSGTSMASPVVAGVAGLAISQWGTDNADTRLHLKNTAVDVGLSSDEQGSGRVDAGTAVATDPGDGGGGGGDEVTETFSASLSGYWDADCWTWEWNFDDPSQLVITLDGPDSGAVFDLYANEGDAQCPTTDDYDYRSYTWGADEQIVVDNPDDSTRADVLVDAWDGSGDYTLTVTEKA